MDSYIRTGFSFGLASGVITTLGLMVGLYSSTESKIAVIGAILTIAVADSFSDAVGIHVSKEVQNKYTTRSLWESTISTLLFKFLVPLIFIIPVLLLDLSTAVWVSVVLGLLLLTLLSYTLALHHKVNVLTSVTGHLAVAVFVILATNFLGGLIGKMFR